MKLSKVKQTCMKEQRMQQTLPAGEIQSLALADISGAVTIQGWDQHFFELTSERERSGLQQRGDTFVLNDVHGNIALHVPFETIVTVRDIRGPLSVENVRQVNVADVRGEVNVQGINGDVTIKDIGQGRVTVREVRGLVHINDINRNVFIEEA